jgi:hypothetical protein
MMHHYIPNTLNNTREKYTRSSSWYYFLHLTVNRSHVKVKLYSFSTSVLEGPSDRLHLWDALPLTLYNCALLVINFLIETFFLNTLRCCSPSIDSSNAVTPVKHLFITVYKTFFFGRFVFNVAEIMYQNGSRIYGVVQQRRRQVLAEIRQLL